MNLFVGFGQKSKRLLNKIYQSIITFERKKVDATDIIYLSLFFIGLIGIIYGFIYIYNHYVTPFFEGSSFLLYLYVLAAPFAWEYAALYNFEQSYSSSWIFISLVVALVSAVIATFSIITYQSLAYINRWVAGIYFIIIGAGVFVYFILVSATNAIKVFLYIIWEYISPLFGM